MRAVRFGRTDVQVSAICLGTSAFGGDLGHVDDRDSIATIRAAWDRGVNFFDTARAYGFGRAERVLGQALRHELRRDRSAVVIATKGGQVRRGGRMVRDTSAASLREELAASLRALGTDHVDVYYVHWPDPRTPAPALGETLGQFVAEGKARWVGVSNFSAEELATTAHARHLDAVQVPYSILRRGVEQDILGDAARMGLGVTAYGALAHGLLAAPSRASFGDHDWRSGSEVFFGASADRNRAVAAELRAEAAQMGWTLPQLAVAWVLANPAVHAAVVGARRPLQAAETASAGDLSLGPEALLKVEQIAAQAVPITGPSPEMRSVVQSSNL